VNSFYGAQYAQVMALAILGALPLLIAFLLSSARSCRASPTPAEGLTAPDARAGS
jgi:hypothetical protein